MKVINNFLTSGHQFSDNENLQRFRFALLNTFMFISLLPIFLNFITTIFGVIEFNNNFEITTWFYAVVCCFVMYILRKNKEYYTMVVVFFITSSLIVFYFILVTHKEDEFRLIAFFLALFITYVLLGKKFGALLAIIIMASIFILSKNYDLKLSSFAYSTFFTFFIIFTVFLYIFLKKIESDAIEYRVLNNKLKEDAKKEIQQRKDQELMLLRQCRMANMGEMLDSIAHQWRQPLMHINSILMNMDVALESKQKDDKYLTSKTDEVATLTMHMSQTIEDFRDLFKLEKKQKQFSLESAINDVLALMKNRFDDISINYKAEGQTLVYGYRSELIQVIIILLSNSVDAFDNQSIKNKKITIHTHVSTDNQVITIEDNAGGIPFENVASIFNPYFTTKEQSGGTGLGLYIVKIIIEHKMSGKISVINTPNGAKFSIVI